MTATTTVKSPKQSKAPKSVKAPATVESPKQPEAPVVKAEPTGKGPVWEVAETLDGFYLNVEDDVKSWSTTIAHVHLGLKGIRILREAHKLSKLYHSRDAMTGADTTRYAKAGEWLVAFVKRNRIQGKTTAEF
jgi:hypothetical protein